MGHHADDVFRPLRRIDGRWYFQRRLPLYWYATDLNKPPIGSRKMRWPGREPYEGGFHDLFPSWKEYWNAASRIAPVAPPAPLEKFIETMRRGHKPPSVRWSADDHPFDPVKLGDLDLPNRIVMAPMTRSRAGDGDVPTDLNVEYYRQRATAGLIVSEGTQPSANGKGYCRTPGIHTPSADRRLAQGHRRGPCRGRQDRAADHALRPDRRARRTRRPGAETVAPSAVRAAGQMFTDTAGMQDFDMPRALETAEIPALIAEFGQATVQRAGGRLRRGRAACRQRLSADAVPVDRDQHADRPYGGSAENRMPRRGRNAGGDGKGRRRRPGRHPHLPGRSVQRYPGRRSGRDLYRHC